MTDRIRNQTNFDGMRNLFILPSLEPQAHTPAGMMFQIAVELSSRGHGCDILLTSETESPEVDIPSAMQLIHLPLGFASRWQKAVALTTERVARRILRATSGRQYDATFVIAPAARYGRLLPEMLKGGVTRRSVVMAYDTYPQAWADLGMVRGELLLKYLRRRECRSASASHVSGLSPGSARFLAQYYESELPPLVIPFFGQPPDPASAPSFEEEGPLRLIFGGRVFYGRWMEGLIGLANRFSEDVVIDCFGGDDLSEKYATTATALGVKNIRFLPAVGSAAYQSLLKEYHAGLATTGPEFNCPSYPSKAVEYMRVGLPILAVTDDLTDYPDLIENQARCGFAGRSSRPETADRALSRLLEARAAGELGQLGENGRTYYAQHFVVERAVDALAEQLGTPDEAPI